jgi:ribosomal protein L11 methyltransferase
MKPQAELYMSGFYAEDVPLIREKAESLGLRFTHSKSQNNWTAVKFVRP